MVLIKDGIGALDPVIANSNGADAVEERERRRKAGRLLTRVQRARRLYSNLRTLKY